MRATMSRRVGIGAPFGIAACVPPRYTGRMSTPCASARWPTSGLNSLTSPVGLRVPSGKMSTVLPRSSTSLAWRIACAQRRLAVDGAEVRQVLEERALDARLSKK